MTVEQHAITTTVSCSVSGAEGHLSAEVDGRYYGYNHGKSMYLPGDSAAVLVFISSNVTIIGTGHSPNCGFSGGAGGNTGGTVATNYFVHETVHLSNPVGNTSKPVESVLTKSGSGNGPSMPNVTLGTTLVYCKEWPSSLQIAAAPKYYFLSLDYNAKHVLYHFSGMSIATLKSSDTCYGSIFGIATPLYP